MDWGWVGLAGTVCGIIFGYAGYKKGMKDEYKNMGEDKGSLKSDITYIKRRTDDVLLEQKETNRNMTLLTERVAKVEEIAKSAHKRLDEHIIAGHKGGM